MHVYLCEKKWPEVKGHGKAEPDYKIDSCASVLFFSRIQMHSRENNKRKTQADFLLTSKLSLTLYYMYSLGLCPSATDNYSWTIRFY